FGHVRLFVNGGVRADLEAGGFGDLDSLDGVAEDPLAFHGDIVVLLHSVKMHVEIEALVGSELADTLFDKHAVGAQVYVMVALQDSGDELADLRVHHGFPTAEGDDGRAGSTPH